MYISLMHYYLKRVLCSLSASLPPATIPWSVRATINLKGVACSQQIWETLVMHGKLVVSVITSQKYISNCASISNQSHKDFRKCHEGSNIS